METQLKKYGQLVISLSGVVAVWWLVSATGLVNPNLFPAPPQVLTAAVELYQDGVLVSDLKISLTRAAVGFTIGASLGVLVGLLTARVFAFKVALEPRTKPLRGIGACR